MTRQKKEERLKAIDWIAEYAECAKKNKRIKAKRKNMNHRGHGGHRERRMVRSSKMILLWPDIVDLRLHGRRNYPPVPTCAIRFNSDESSSQSKLKNIFYSCQGTLYHDGTRAVRERPLRNPSVWSTWGNDVMRRSTQSARRKTNGLKQSGKIWITEGTEDTEKDEWLDQAKWFCCGLTLLICDCADGGIIRLYPMRETFQ
jgi:hypothetical protein